MLQWMNTKLALRKQFRRCLVCPRLLPKGTLMLLKKLKVPCLFGQHNKIRFLSFKQVGSGSCGSTPLLFVLLKLLLSLPLTQKIYLVFLKCPFISLVIKTIVHC